MEQLNLLLQKFWDNQISLSELKELYRLLSVHKDELSNTVYVNFNHIEQEVADRITSEKSTHLLQNIHDQLGLNKQNAKVIPIHKSLIKIAVAASVIGIVFLAVNLFTRRVDKLTYEIVKADKPASNPLQSFTNSTNANQSIVLDDGSIIELTPKSAITFYKPFINSRRDISLTGSAFFKVAKNKTQPFTVYANGISTTALGTQFWVYASDLANTDVHLIEGKVVIKVAQGANIAMNDVYLLPGQKFSFNKVTNQVLVNNTNNNLQPEKLRDNKTTITGKKENKNVLIFNNQPIDRVLQKIEQVYKQPLLFNKSDVIGLTFTGTFLPTDSIDVVLSTICIMNELSFVNEGHIIKISKRN